MVAMVRHYYLKFCQTISGFKTTLYLSTGKIWSFSLKNWSFYSCLKKKCLYYAISLKKKSAETCSTHKKNNTAEQGLSQASNTGKPSTF